MRVLFVHKHFPGPFHRLAQRFGERGEATVLFLSERQDKSMRLPGVRRLRLDRLPEGTPAVLRAETSALVEQSIQHALQTGKALLRLRKQGFFPSIIYSVASDSRNFCFRDIFPDALHVVRAQWFYGRDETHFPPGRKARPLADAAALRVENMFRANAVMDSDLTVAPSEWQKEQFPESLRAQIRVMHDGVDSRFFSPLPRQRFTHNGLDLSGISELVTFSRRRIDSGFSTFAASLPHILTLRSGCRALIMVDDTKEATDLLNAFLPQDLRGRAHIVEFNSPLAYRMLLRASTVNVHLAAPRLLSAGLFEAMSCGALLAGSDTPPVREVIRHGINGFLIDPDNSEALGNIVVEMLARAPVFGGIREAARRTVLEHYDLENQSAAHHALLLQSLDDKKRRTFPAPKHTTFGLDIAV